MANWRESGEVPDSEDDDFDSQITDQPSLPPTLQGSVPSRTPIGVKDIWDIPSSQDDDGLARSDTPTFQHSKQLSVDSSLSTLSPSRTPDDSYGAIQASLDTSNDPPPSSSPVLSEAPVVDSYPNNLDQHDTQQRDTLSPLSREQLSPLPSQILGHDAEELLAAQRLIIATERSLRTRKPEQLRPYQTERARFNSEWRQHGLRPVRIANDEDRRDQNDEELLEEAEFQPETQESTSQHILDEGSVDLGRNTAPSSQRSLDPPDDKNMSSQVSIHDDTDNTTLDGEELPSLEDLMSGRYKFGQKRSTKRRAYRPSKDAGRDREPHLDLVSDGEGPKFIMPPGSPDPMDISRVGSRPAIDLEGDGLASSPISNHLSPTGPTSYNHPSVSQDLQMADHDSAEVADPFESSEQSQLEDGNLLSSASSESESDIVNQNSRRIKGVLPASWLRLDQKSSRNKFQRKITRRPLDPLQLDDNRRGVARRKEASSFSNSNNFVFEESEEESTDIPNGKRQDRPMHIQKTLEIENMTILPMYEISSDDESIMEHDYIEPLLPSRKRQTKLPDTFNSQPKRQKVSKAASGLPSKTSKAASHYKQGPSLHARSLGDERPISNARRKQKNPRAVKHAKAIRNVSPAPRLSILDVIEPDAPRFVRIAARTVKGRRDRGRGSPNGKSIQLATRKDHIDAISALRDWTSGSIKQRPSVSGARQTKATSKSHFPVDNALSQFSARLNKASIMKQKSNQLTKTKRTASISLNNLQTRKSLKNPVQMAALSHQSLSHTRLAQLEVDDNTETARFRFSSGKKTLDHLYRGDASGSEPIPLLSSSKQISFSHNRNPLPKTQQAGIGKNKRYRKHAKPRRIDTEAPQYSHANDPLPPVLDQTLGLPTDNQMRKGAKLFGLGPYGTQYTHHFEVFPLHPSVFFNDTSLIGTGAIEKAVSTEYPQSLWLRKQQVTFTLDGERFQWGEWTSQVSSELGLLLDHIVDQIDIQNGASSTPDGSDAIAGAAFLLSYVTTALSITTDSDLNSFLSRILEAIQNFNTRIISTLESKISLGDSLLQPIAQVLDYILVILYLCVRISRTDPSLLREQFLIENVLKSSASITIQVLLQIGPHRVRQALSDLDHSSRRGSGLGAHDLVIHSWVVTMKVLEVAQVPQASFWAIFQRAVLSPTFLSSLDVREHERVWDSLFILLPLTEFSNVGKVVSGERHRISSDGWGLPQQLLKRIFHLYQENKHQSPGFNDYCRALIGRCHYLVEQWGWHKCASIVGVIFDFFGSQSLAHLRNEEAYNSPRFLEELGYQPSLTIEREDRCFHIFLKLIALGLQKLRAAGSLKDIRNLVARVVPNHNRQYLKEQNIHERDLAALRNHHDLLCTLFWASPPELRPNVNLIQSLVVPANSHKAACLINLRTWSQLARFVVVSGEATTSLRPFNAWRSSFFQQILEQYESVAPDIEQQLSNLSKDVTKAISSEMVSAMISWNKTAVTDVLYTSAAVSLEVIQHAPDLEAGLFCLGVRQLQQVFSRFSSTPPGLDWQILRASLLTLETLLNQVDEFKANEQSQESESQILNSALADDALQVLSHDIASLFFSMTHCIVSAGDNPRSSDQSQCTELAVVLAARLGMRLSETGSIQFLELFKPGENGLWRSLPHGLSINQRKYLPVFITALLRHGFYNWSEGHLILIELWLISVVKPREAFGYEKDLAEQLISHGEVFVPNTVKGLVGDINYEIKRRLLEHAISSMRKSIRDAEPGPKRSLQLEHGKVLKRIMLLMRNDLKILLRDTNEHHMYMGFVREAIALIKTHASDFCTIDDFFYQVNQEYSPPQQDPQLQVATLVSYGIRLADGDTKVEHPLFFFLLNQLKLAVMDDGIHEEAILLCSGMQTNGLLGFILGKMFPAIIEVSRSESVAALPMVDIYTHAFQLLLEEDGGQGQLLTSQYTEELQIVLRYMIQSIHGLGPAWPSSEELHLVRQYLAFMNLLWPSLYAINLSPKMSVTLEAHGIRDLLRRGQEWTSVVEAQLRCALENGRGAWGIDSLFPSTERRLEVDGSNQSQVGIARLAESIITDVRKNWITLGDRLTIQAPGQRRATQSTQAGHGIQKPQWDQGDLVVDLFERLQEWNYWWERAFGMGPTGEKNRIEENQQIFF
ncbi:unnamed protein product [Clonostachys rosea]|uniref:Orc1-like AAA ATPase domain-containing protein n=1 Tax=Bionectria ochroleuca TaxID=29856 RepID=A0ABY6USZ6_BIOOC|nr:unnamed protein product [Clonostachys rosea]